jgi:hypothetical protein
MAKCKKEKEYLFDIRKPNSGKLNLYACSPSEAERKAKSWERWLVKEKRGNDKVKISSIKEVQYIGNKKILKKI